MQKVLIQIILSFSLLHLIVFCAYPNFMGIPNINNYHKENYNAGNQNWAIEQDDLGVMYFANNNGVLIYDGMNWANIPVPNNSVVRSLHLSNRNRILVGAFNEIGTIERDSLGNYFYRSWTNKLPENQLQFADIWKIHTLDQHIYFQSYSHVFIFDQDENLITTLHYSESELAFSFIIENSVILQDKSSGLQRIRNTAVEQLTDLDILGNMEIWNIYSIDENTWLLFTQQDGIFRWDGKRLFPWKSELTNYLKQNNFYCLTYDDDFFYIGTIQNGLIVADKQGNILKIIDRTSGLQNNTVLSIKLDAEKNLWLGLDNGIDYIEWNSNVKYIGRNGTYGTGYSSAIWKNHLYLGTNQGVFKTSMDAQNEVSLIQNLKGQVWDLWIDDDNLLCAHHNGIFSIQENGVEVIELLQGCWNFLPLPWDSSMVLVGTYNGIGLMRKIRSSYQFIEILPGFHESARIMLFDNLENLWVSHGYKGLYKINLNKENLTITSVKYYGVDKGLPFVSNNEIYNARNENIIATSEGIYRYNEISDSIVSYPLWNKFLGNTERVSNLIEVDENRIYVFQDGILGLLEILNDSLFIYNRQITPSLNNHFIEAFEDILILDEGRLIVGIDDGFAMIDHEKDQEQYLEIPFLFTGLECYSTQKFQDIVQPIAFNTYDEPIIISNRIPYRYNNIRVGFSVPLYNSSNNIRYSFTLNDTYWEGKPNQSELFLTNLHEGKYSLDIHLSNTKTGQKSVRNIQFSINAPWYRQWYFYTFLGLLILSIAFISYKIIKRRVDYERRKELIAQKRKMIQREIRLKQKSALAEKELIKIRNEKLQSEVIHKSKELANSTMNIIHKNQILTDLKNEMMELPDDQSVSIKRVINPLIRKIDTELENQQSWDVFETHFDRVHENFFLRLREKHHELSPKDLRMCAFLRMNLSSKEIAPLQNISIRSVEISRYRLRKKLKIPHEQNLTDYIMNI